MARRSNLQGITNDLVQSFVSRNNDIDGYWALGHLLARALSDQIKRVDISLLRLDATQSDGLDRAIGSKYSDALAKMMASSRIPSTWVVQAKLTVEFELEAQVRREAGVKRLVFPFRVSIRLDSDLGKTTEASSSGFCCPHAPSEFLRSTRVPATN